MPGMGGGGTREALGRRLRPRLRAPETFRRPCPHPHRGAGHAKEVLYHPRVRSPRKAHPVPGVRFSQVGPYCPRIQSPQGSRVPSADPVTLRRDPSPGADHPEEALPVLSPGCCHLEEASSCSRIRSPRGGWSPRGGSSALAGVAAEGKVSRLVRSLEVEVPLGGRSKQTPLSQVEKGILSLRSAPGCRYRVLEMTTFLNLKDGIFS